MPNSLGINGRKSKVGGGRGGGVVGKDGLAKAGRDPYSYRQRGGLSERSEGRAPAEAPTRRLAALMYGVRR